ncbi:MAG: hypothetical protein WBC13_09740 [Dokdonella sp.]
MKKTHEQFLEDLLLKNDRYRNGEFEVLSEYECSECDMIVETKFGLCKTLPDNLLKGQKPSIRSAVDKTEFFKNMCIDRFGDNNDDLSEVEWVNSVLKIKVKCRVFNEYYYITPSSYYKGSRSKKVGTLRATEATRLDQDYIFERIKELHPELELLPNQVYKNDHNHLLLRDKYGVVKSQPGKLLRGHIPTIRSAVDPTEYFINQAREVHGDKYDYSLVEYVNDRSKIKIISKYGIFEQISRIHLNGHGCPTDGFNRMTEFNKENILGWSYKNWEAAAKRSKNFTGYKVYFIECWDTESEERFFKVGKTFRGLKDRFHGIRAMPYSYKVLNIIESDDAREICELEQFYKAENREFLYTPSKEFGGMYECFSNLKNY